jgi:hypothetical protein
VVFQNQERGHHLGRTCWKHGLVRIFLEKNLTAVTVKEYCGFSIEISLVQSETEHAAMYYD